MTKAELTYHDVQITTAWPTRGCVAPFGTESPCDPVYRQPAAFRLWYEPILAIGELRIVAQGWTFFECKYRFPFNGTSDALATWLRTKAGVRRAYQDAQAYQNSVIDRMKAAYPFNTDIANLRHFGPADWPFITVVAGGMPVLTIANPALRAELTTVPLEIRETLMQEDPPSSVLAGLLRAYDLLQCGYPTESVVVAFSLLDAFLQEELTSRMEAKGLSQQAGIYHERRRRSRSWSSIPLCSILIAYLHATSLSQHGQLISLHFLSRGPFFPTTCMSRLVWSLDNLLVY